jgi:hypothetical protein
MATVAAWLNEEADLFDLNNLLGEIHDKKAPWSNS